MENYLIKGLLIGLVFGVPAGSIGALTIERTLAGGFRAGLFTGAGSSVADVLYACVGVFGLTVISDFLLSHQKLIGLVGGMLIILLGVLIFRKKGGKPTLRRDAGIRSYALCFSSAFAVAITNPATILSFFLAFASFGVAEKLSPPDGTLLIIGILTGTLCWWAGLAGIVSAFRAKVTDAIYQRLNWILGCLMAVFGVIVLIRALTT
ncbi:MAG: LysE family transporter [Eubacteriales bacterium]|nr:LysE family transporter [Eubacteriales bacterium]